MPARSMFASSRSSGGPAVIAARRRTVDVAARVLTARVEIALISFASEVVAPAPLRERKRNHLVVRIIGADGQLALLRLPRTLADELHGIAVANHAIDAEPGAVVALRVAQENAERPIRPFLSQQIEGKNVVEGYDLPAPTVRTLRTQLDRRRVFEPDKQGRRGRWIPMAEDSTLGLELASKRPLAVRQVEAQLAAFDAYGQRPSHHLGGVRRCRPFDDQRAARKGTEPALRFPQARELVSRSGGSRRLCGNLGERQNKEAGEKANPFHFSFPRVACATPRAAPTAGPPARRSWRDAGTPPRRWRGTAPRRRRW